MSRDSVVAGLFAILPGGDSGRLAESVGGEEQQEGHDEDGRQ